MIHTFFFNSFSYLLFLVSVVCGAEVLPIGGPIVRPQLLKTSAFRRQIYVFTLRSHNCVSSLEFPVSRYVTGNR